MFYLPRKNEVATTAAATALPTAAVITQRTTNNAFMLFELLEDGNER